MQCARRRPAPLPVGVKPRGSAARGTMSMSGGAGGSERPAERQCEPRPGKSLPVPALARSSVLKALLEEAERPRGAEVSEELRRAQEEWEAVEETQAGPGGLSAGSAPLISFNEALQYFQSAELSQCRKKVQVPVPRSGLASLFRFLFSPPRLHPQLQEEQELALAMAQCALDDNQKVHMRILQTVYKRLTSSRLGCPRYGAHWEELGFQGVDPGTDLRGTGMLGLMQILYLVMDSQMLPLARDIFRLSQHETQSFPFCLMSVNITRMVLQALRQDRLCRECNRRGQVIAVLNQLYAAAFLRLSRRWGAQQRTLADSGALLRELETCTRRRPKQLLSSLQAYMEQSPRARCPQAGTGQDVDLVGICDPQVELEGAARLM